MMVSQPSQRIHHIGVRSGRKWKAGTPPLCASSCLVVRSCVRSCFPTSALGCPYVYVVAELQTWRDFPQTWRFTEQICIFCCASLRVWDDGGSVSEGWRWGWRRGQQQPGRALSSQPFAPLHIAKLHIASERGTAGGVWAAFTQSKWVNHY
jgi:hypothetical protein